MVDDPLVAALRRKFVAMPRAEVAREAAQLRVLMRGGQVYSASTEHCIGAHGVPISDDDLSGKTTSQLESVYSPALSARVLQQAWKMAQAPRADGLCELLRQPYA
jgi:hypothetical protein